MKRIYIIIFLAATCALTAMAQNRPGMAHQTSGRDRFEENTSLSVPQVDYSSDGITVTNVSGFWTIWISNQLGDMCMVPTSYEGEQECIPVGFEVEMNVKYIISITTSVGATYKWVLKNGITSPYGGVAPTVEPNNSSHGLWPGLSER